MSPPRNQQLLGSRCVAFSEALIALSLLAACGSDSGATKAADDDAGAVARDVDARDSDESSRTVGEFDCNDGDYAETGLQLIPEFVTAFRHIDSECESLAPRILLRNTRQSPVQIKGARVSARFSVDSFEVPLTLLPEQAMPIQVRYLGDALDSEGGALTLSTSAGCIDFAVRGLATDGGLMTQSDLAIDFGAARAGSLSAPRELIVRYQRKASFARTIFEGFSAAPSEFFELIASPDGPQSPESCGEIRFQMRFRAPQMLGRIEGALGWFATTETDDGVVEGTVFVPLYGTTIAD